MSISVIKLTNAKIVRVCSICRHFSADSSVCSHPRNQIRIFLVNWDIEHQIWDQIFGKQCLNVSTEKTSVIVTEPYFNFASIKDTTDEIIFENYGFASALRINGNWLLIYLYIFVFFLAGTLCALNYLEKHSDQQCCLLVDSGYSFTHIAPYCRGKLIKDGVIRLVWYFSCAVVSDRFIFFRISVGGKALTNQLKEWISYRQLDVLEETFVMNQCKEDVCYVSNNFDADMKIARFVSYIKLGGKFKKYWILFRLRGNRNTILREYVLPDFLNIDRGYVRKPGESKSDQQVYYICVDLYSFFSF